MNNPLKDWLAQSGLEPEKFWRQGMLDVNGNQIVRTHLLQMSVCPWTGRFPITLDLVLEEGFERITLGEPDPNYIPNIAYLEADVGEAFSAHILLRKWNSGWTWEEEHRNGGYRKHHKTKVDALMDALRAAPATQAREQAAEVAQTLLDGFPPGWSVSGGMGDWWVVSGIGIQSKPVNTREDAVKLLWTAFGTPKERWERILELEKAGTTEAAP